MEVSQAKGRAPQGTPGEVGGVARHKRHGRRQSAEIRKNYGAVREANREEFRNASAKIAKDSCGASEFLEK